MIPDCAGAPRTLAPSLLRQVLSDDDVTYVYDDVDGGGGAYTHTHTHTYIHTYTHTHTHTHTYIHTYIQAQELNHADRMEWFNN